ncbi:MAG: TIR domain-containing protein, partial [Synechococcus sp.]
MAAVEDPEKNPPNKVFISYAREDREWAARKADDYDEVNQNYFLDYKSIRSGENWRERLEKEVKTADRVVLIWSKYAAQSDWVRQEYLAALEKGNDVLRIDLLDSTPLPGELKGIQAKRHRLAPPKYVTDRLLKEPTREPPEGDLRPSILLRAEYGVVPFVGRQELLEEYEQWCEEDSLFAVRLLTGAGGLGKTRFAIELCKHLRQKYWETAFVDRIEFERYLNNPEAANGLMKLRRPTLLVVDYAETRREQVKELFRAAKTKDFRQPVRVLLIARSEGEWWQQLLKESHDHEVLVGKDSEPRRLLPLASELTDRESVYQEAVFTYSRLLEKPWPTFAPSLANEDFNRVLFIHLAALAAMEGKKIEQRDKLLDFGVERECGYWLKKARDLGLSTELAQQDVLAEGATMLVLAGGCNRQRLRGVLQWQPDLAELTRLQLKQFARVYSELYGTAERIEPLQPDLLGERLVETAFIQSDELRTAWVRPSEPSELFNGLTVLNRVAARKPDTESWLAEVFQEDLERSAFAAVFVALAGGDPIGRVLANYLLVNANPELSKALMELVPAQTLALRELAETTTTQSLDSSEANQEERARLVHNQSIRLSYLGRREEALRAAEEAVEIRRQQAQIRSDAFLPQLARSLNNLGVRLNDLGRREEALCAVEEAVEIYRLLAQGQPNTFLSDLALGLTNLGPMLSYLGRREEALRANEDAVEIFRQLAQSRPDAFLSDLALSLNNLGNRLSNLEQKEEALRATEEAVEIYRQLAQRRPDAFLPDLARSWKNLGSR